LPAHHFPNQQHGHLPLLQKQRLPWDPRSAPFLQRLEQFQSLGHWLNPPGVRPNAMLQHLLALGVIPELLERILALAATALSDGETLAAPAPALDGEHAATVEDADAYLCLALRGILHPLCVAVCPTGDATKVDTHEEHEPLVRHVMQQILACPDVLAAAVEAGLSPQVQQAARAGHQPAQQCMDSVCGLFRRMAYLLLMHHMTTPAQTWARDSEGSPWRSLTAFLKLQDVQPFLELLCLPLDHGERASSWQHLGASSLLTAAPTMAPSP
jgi:hypothetical protein